MFAIADKILVLCDGAVLGDVPDWTVGFVFGIGVVSAALVVDGDGVKGDEHAMDEAGEDRWEDVEDVHGRFGEHEEHGEDDDDEVVIRDAGGSQYGVEGESKDGSSQ